MNCSRGTVEVETGTKAEAVPDLIVSADVALEFVTKLVERQSSCLASE